MSRRFEGRSVPVTGGGSGIGRAIATRLVAEGARVMVNDIRAEGAYRHYAYVYGYTADEISPAGELGTGTGASS